MTTMRVCDVCEKPIKPYAAGSTEPNGYTIGDKDACGLDHALTLLRRTYMHRNGNYYPHHWDEAVTDLLYDPLAAIDRIAAVLDGREEAPVG